MWNVVATTASTPWTYEHIAAWAQALPGEIIACENAGATWLPFGPLADVKSTKGFSQEVVWRRWT